MTERWVAGWVQVQEEEEQEVVMMAWSWLEVVVLCWRRCYGAVHEG